MKGLLCAALLAAFLAAVPVLAQPQTVTCEDGSVWTVSPFNPDPCGNLEEPLAEDEYPVDFLLVYGPPPTPTGSSFDDRVARVRYQSNLKHFEGLISEPAGFPAAFYASWGMGDPVFFATRYGKYARWPDALGRPAQASIVAAVKGAGVVVASWQSRAIMDGHCQFDVHAFVPPRLVSRNTEICGQ